MNIFALGNLGALPDTVLPRATVVEPPHARQARVERSRARLRESVSQPNDDHNPARIKRRDDLHRAILSGIQGEHVRIDLSACHERAVHELDPAAAKALVAVLDEPDSHITLPKRMSKLPKWIFECSRIGSVEVPDFAGERVDLSSWKPQDEGHRPLLTLSMAQGAYSRVLVPPNMRFEGQGEIEAVSSFASDLDIMGHVELLKSCVNPKLLDDPRILHVQPFVEQDFVRPMDDGENPVTAELLEPALPLIIDHYRELYGTAIEVLRYPDGAVLRLDDEGAMDHLRAAVDAARARNPGEDFRFAFIVQVDSRHWAPLFYLRESGTAGQREALFYPDSQGTELSPVIERLLGNFDMPIMILAQGRQADYASCKTDALVWARDITVRSPLDGTYEESRLLGTIARDAKAFRIDPALPELQVVVHLPSTLLKTAQRKSFLQAFPPDESEASHVRRNGVHESIADFRKRHTELNVPVVRDGEDVLKDLPHYARFKGFQLVRTARIRHAHQELTRVFGADYDRAVADEFIANAKQHIDYMDQLQIDRGDPEDGMDMEFDSRQSDSPT